jgi:HSP20 family protein
MEGSSPNGGGDSKDRYEDRIKELERKITELEKRKTSTGTSSADADEPQIEGIVEGVVGQFIPGLGGIIKALEKSSPEFRKRIADTDSEIKHRIDVGWSSKPVVDYHVSTRPMSGRRRSSAPTPQVKMPANGPSREPIVDIFQDNDYTTIIAELPGVLEAELEVKLEGKSLLIKAGEFSKTLDLPGEPGAIIERTYKNGILQLKIAKA